MWPRTGKTFRKFDKTGDGKINMEEFVDACDSVHPLTDDMKYQLGTPPSPFPPALYSQPHSRRWWRFNGRST